MLVFCLLVVGPCWFRCFRLLCACVFALLACSDICFCLGWLVALFRGGYCGFAVSVLGLWFGSCVVVWWLVCGFRLVCVFGLVFSLFALF